MKPLWIIIFVMFLSCRKEAVKLLLNFHHGVAGSSWIAVGDADNDGNNEIVLASGKGDRTKNGTSYVLMIEKSK